jgi:AcrR family transcriptional regulator
VRKTGTRERALSAAAEILRHHGYSRLTMERVAAESGVAKTTLYRRWPTRAALCMELYLEVAGRELHDPDTGDIASDLRHICNTNLNLFTGDLLNRHSFVTGLSSVCSLVLRRGGSASIEHPTMYTVSEGTVKNHVSSILSKLGVRDRTRAVLKALELGFI